MTTVGAVAVILLLLTVPSFGQNTFPPASFKNLQVLPKDSPAASSSAP